MIKRLGLLWGESTNPWYNLAVEEMLLEAAGEDMCILYLWQNENTVVIGRNQNPWKECKSALLEQEGGKLARRLSGGGAVFHDLGNLNFTFLMPQSDYDLDRQLRVIQEAVASFGVPTERSGRNDVLAAGRKFSGNAFYKNGKQAYHHGTLLISADQEKLGRYLSPSKAKLQAKGVDSVRSRVVNLSELEPSITVDTLGKALEASFRRVYGMEPERMTVSRLDPERLKELTRRNSSWEWNFGRKMECTLSMEERFSWGGVELELLVDSGVIQEAKVWSDAMDWSLAQELETVLIGCRLDPAPLTDRLSGREEFRDVLTLLKQI